jgi:predicted RNA binding protein YcfA (HicA-like mRNA interferase family)
MMGALALVMASACAEGDPLAPTVEFAPSVVPASNTYRGRAFVAAVGALGLNVRVVDTGPLSPAGGVEHASLLTLSVPPLLTAGVAGASTVGLGSLTHSHAAVANVVLRVGILRIGADVIQAAAVAACREGAAFHSGRSLLAGLKINGKSIVVTGKPNQTISIGLAKVIINEQVVSSSGITVNALHVKVPLVADVVISSAQAGISCAPGCPPSTGDFVTGAGVLAQSQQAFEISAGIRDGVPFGHFTSDGSDIVLRSTSITSYEILSATERRIQGTAVINGQNGTFDLVVTDNGSPGTNDVFSIVTSTGWHVTRTLGSGDIEVHPDEGGCPE